MSYARKTHQAHHVSTLQRITHAVTLAAAIAAATPVHASVLGFVEFEGTENDNTAPGNVTLQVVESPDGKFLYSTAFGANPRETTVLNVYMRDAQSGALDLIQTLNNPPGIDYGLSDAAILEISPDGKFIYVRGYNYDPYVRAISWFARDPATGMLSYAGKIKADEVPVVNAKVAGPLRTSPDGFFLYVGGESAGGSIFVFRRADNGALSFVETASNNADLQHLKTFAVSLDGKSVYAVSATAKSLVAFSRDPETGKLSHQQTFFDITTGVADGIPGLAGPEDVIVTDDGRFVYATGMIGNDTATPADDQYAVLRFARDATTSKLQYLETKKNVAEYKGNPAWDTLKWPTSVALSVDVDQKFLYVGTRYYADSVNVFRRNAQDGGLSWVGWETEGQNGVTNLSGVQDITVSNDGRHIYAALEEGDGITVFDTRADVSIVKKDGTDPVTPGQALTYTLIATNNGPSDAQNVVITDTLPDGMTFVKASSDAPGASCTQDAGTLTCNLGTLANTATVTTTVEVTAPVAVGVVTNTASITADQLDTEMSNNTDSEETCVDTADGNVCRAPDGGAGSPAPATGDSASGGGGSLSWLTLLGIAAARVRRRATR